MDRKLIQTLEEKVNAMHGMTCRAAANGIGGIALLDDDTGYLIEQHLDRILQLMKYEKPAFPKGK